MMNRHSIFGYFRPKFEPQLEMGIILKFTQTKMDYLQSVAVCVCVCVYVCVCVCVCACACVCVCSFNEKTSSVCEMSETYLRGTDRSTILCCEYQSRCFCQVPSSPFLKMSYFISKDETSARRQLERKRYNVWFQEKMIYIDIGYKSATQQIDK